MLPRPGMLVGSYRVLRPLGAGGSGQVFEAEEEALGRRVAIKLLTRGQQATPAQLERFRREREALARLDHPHLLRVHTAGVWQGTPYVVTELLPGRTLRDLLASGPPPLEEALRLTREVAAGLGALHAVGLVHRDLKPENVLLDAQGRAKVADLGLVVGEEDRQVTRTGAFLGTPDYMAPEGFRGEVLRSPRVDVYALGLLLHELLTGRLPHEATSLVALMQARIERPQADPRALRPELPAPVAEVCWTALAGAPEARHADAGAFARALEAACQGRPTARRRRPLAFALLVVIVLALAWLMDGLRGPLAPTLSAAALAEPHLSDPAALETTWSGRIARGLLTRPAPCDGAALREEARALLGAGNAPEAATRLWAATRGPERDLEAALRLVRLLGRGGPGLPAAPAAARDLLGALSLHEPRLDPARLDLEWAWTGPGGLGRTLERVRGRLASDPRALEGVEPGDPARRVVEEVAGFEGWGGRAPDPEGAIQRLAGLARGSDPDLAWLAQRWLLHAAAVGHPGAAAALIPPRAAGCDPRELDLQDLLAFDRSRALAESRDVIVTMRLKGLHDAAMTLGESFARSRALRDVAQQGYPGAAFELAQALWNGTGLDKDPSAALGWYALGALNGPEGCASGLAWAWVWLGSAVWADRGPAARGEALVYLRTGMARIDALTPAERALHASDKLTAEALICLAALEGEGDTPAWEAGAELDRILERAGASDSDRVGLRTAFLYQAWAGNVWACFELGSNPRFPFSDGDREQFRQAAVRAGVTARPGKPAAGRD